MPGTNGRGRDGDSLAGAILVSEYGRKKSGEANGEDEIQENVNDKRKIYQPGSAEIGYFD